MKEYTLIEPAMQEIMQELLSTPMNGNYQIIIRKRKVTRTAKQNRCIHLYCTQLATALNDAGIDQRTLLNKFKGGFRVQNTMESIKQLFQQVAGTLTGEDRTSKLSTTEMQEVYDTFDMGISQKTGVHIEWPHDEPPLIEEHEVK